METLLTKPTVVDEIGGVKIYRGIPVNQPPVPKEEIHHRVIRRMKPGDCIKVPTQKDAIRWQLRAYPIKHKMSYRKNGKCYYVWKIK